MTRAEQQDPIQTAAISLWERMGDSSEDVLDEACADTWPDGVGAWWNHDMSVPEAEEHRERIFRQIMVRFGEGVAQRGAGQIPAFEAAE